MVSLRTTHPTPNVGSYSSFDQFPKGQLSLGNVWSAASPKEDNMAGERLVFKEVLPKQGLLFTEQTPMPVLCKPKIMPMKSVTLEKLETMQKEAQEAVKRQEQEQKLHGVFT